MEQSYPIAAEALDLEVYTLAALVAGSGVLKDLEVENPGFAWARQTFEASEVSRRLVSLAVLLRGLLDGSTVGGEVPVGRLVPNTKAESDSVELTLREACNKIIHARDIDLSAGRWEDLEHPPVSQTVVLEGSLREVPWRAELDVPAFLGAASRRF